jgi:hypothetical protein
VVHVWVIAPAREGSLLLPIGDCGRIETRA